MHTARGPMMDEFDVDIRQSITRFSELIPEGINRGSRGAERRALLPVGGPSAACLIHGSGSGEKV